jgi:hypothetical protein
MPEDAKKAWSEVGERFASWGERVARRYRETDTGRSADERDRELERAAKEIVDELGRGVSAFADTVRDDEAKKELTEAFRAVGDAISTTFDEVRAGIRSKDTPTSPPPRPEAGPPAPPEPPERPHAQGPESVA